MASRLAKASVPNAALSPNSSAVAAAALARAGSNTGSAAGNENQMSNFLFDDELDAELHSACLMICLVPRLRFSHKPDPGFALFLPHSIPTSNPPPLRLYLRRSLPPDEHR